MNNDKKQIQVAYIIFTHTNFHVLKITKGCQVEYWFTLTFVIKYLNVDVLNPSHKCLNT